MDFWNAVLGQAAARKRSFRRRVETVTVDTDQRGGGGGDRKKKKKVQWLMQRAVFIYRYTRMHATRDDLSRPLV